MSTVAAPPPPIPYAGPLSGNCPLCHNRPIWKKTIYGHPVCKKCYYAFANRRQLGYLVDALIWIVPSVIVTQMLVQLWVRFFPLNGVGAFLFPPLLGIPLMCVFLMKDGFTGQSPGKRLADLQVLDERTSQPIGFGQSFRRNAILLLGQIPLVGGLASLVVIIGIAVQVGRGYRWGDRYAHTRVIWKKYARLRVFGGDDLVCETCGYDLQGNRSGVCPECGQAVSERNTARLLADGAALAAGDSESINPSQVYSSEP